MLDIFEGHHLVFGAVICSTTNGEPFWVQLDTIVTNHLGRHGFVVEGKTFDTPRRYSEASWVLCSAGNKNANGVIIKPVQVSAPEMTFENVLAWANKLKHPENGKPIVFISKLHSYALLYFVTDSLVNPGPNGRMLGPVDATDRTPHPCFSHRVFDTFRTNRPDEPSEEPECTHGFCPGGSDTEEYSVPSPDRPIAPLPNRRSLRVATNVRFLSTNPFLNY